jgi:hypothetical protein
MNRFHTCAGGDDVPFVGQQVSQHIAAILVVVGDEDTVDTGRSWFEHFEGHRLMFVYEEEVADRAYAAWQARGGGHGHDRRDWFEAEGQLVAGGARSMNRYPLKCAPIGE